MEDELTMETEQEPAMREVNVDELNQDTVITEHEAEDPVVEESTNNNNQRSPLRSSRRTDSKKVTKPQSSLPSHLKMASQGKIVMRLKRISKKPEGKAILSELQTTKIKTLDGLLAKHIKKAHSADKSRISTRGESSNSNQNAISGSVQRPAARQNDAGTTTTAQDNVVLSPMLACLLNRKKMTKIDIVKKIWSMAKERRLLEVDGKTINCDRQLRQLFGLDSINLENILKNLERNSHVTKPTM